MSSNGAKVLWFVDLGFACTDLARVQASQWKSVEAVGSILPST